MNNRVAIVGSVLLVALGVAYFLIKKKKNDDDDDDKPAKCDTSSLIGKAFYITANNGQQVSGGSDGYTAFSTNRDSWERWGFEANKQVSGAVQIKNMQHGLYLQAYDNGGVDSSTSSPDTWESFKVEFLDDSCKKIALKSYHGFYLGVSSDNTGLTNQAATVGVGETFMLTMA